MRRGEKGVWLALVLACAVFGCGDRTDEIGGGGCEDEYDLILKGEVEDFSGTRDVEFKAKLDVREGNRALGSIKFDGRWYEVIDSGVTHDDVSILFAEQGAELLADCPNPDEAQGVFYLLEVVSENGLAGPFEGELTAICGPDFATGEQVGDYDASAEVTCEDL